MATPAARTSGGLTAALAALAAALDALAGTDLGAEDEEALTAAVPLLERSSVRLEGRGLRRLAEAVRRDLPGRCGLATIGAWLRQQVPTVDRGTATGRGAQALALFGLDELADTLDLTSTRDGVLSGEVSSRHATYITQALSRLVPPATPEGLVDEITLAEAQQALAEQSARQSPAVVRAMAERLVAGLDPQAGERLARGEGPPGGGGGGGPLPGAPR